MMSLGVTPATSKFNLPTEVVTVNMHCFSPPTWLEGVGGLASLSTNLVVGTTQLSASAGLAAHMVTRFFGVSVLILADGIIMLPLRETSADPGRLVSAGEVVCSPGGDSLLGVHPGDARMVSSVPWVIVGEGSTPPISAVVGRAMVPSFGASVSLLLASGTVPPRLQKISCLLKVMCPSTHHFSSTTLIAKGQ